MRTRSIRKPNCHGIATEEDSRGARSRPYLAEISHGCCVTELLDTGTGEGMKKSTTPLPTADLSDELWDATQIAGYLKLRPSAAYERISVPGFPAPISNSRRFRRWLADDVRGHFTASRTRVRATEEAAPTDLPKVEFRPRRGVAA